MYKSQVAIACLMSLVYTIGVPLVLLVWLFKFRHVLNPPAEVYESHNHSFSGRDLRASSNIDLNSSGRDLRSSSHVTNARTQILADRREFANTEPIVHFALMYEPHYYGYEVYALLRRLLLTSFPLVFNKLASTTIFVLTIAIVVRWSEPRPARAPAPRSALPRPNLANPARRAPSTTPHH